MERRSVNAIAVPTLLLFLGGIATVMALVRVVQIPLGLTPEDAAHLMTRPIPLWLHAAAGASFAILGALQFGRVLAGRYGWWHRIMGRVFVLAGAVLGLSGVRLVLAFHGGSTPVLDLARIAGGAALLVALWLAVRAIRAREVPRHRTWMIRAYAVGMGQSLVAFVLFPVYLITGEPPTGLLADMTVVASWVICIAAAELILRRIAASAGKPSVNHSQRAA